MKKIALVFTVVFLLILFKTEVSSAQTEFVSLLRYYNKTNKKHIICTDPNELGGGAEGYVYEKTIGYLAKGKSYTLNVYRWYNSSNGAHYCTMSTTTAPDGFAFEGALGNYNFGGVALATVSILEYYNSATQDFLYTNDATSENLSGYTLDGTAFYASATD